MNKLLRFAVLFAAQILLVGVFACSKSDDENSGNNGGGGGSTLFPKGKVTAAGQGVSDVVVTDGLYFAKTAQDGSYELPYNDKATFVYLSVPAGYTILVENGAAIFWKKLADVKDRSKVDFELTATGDDVRHQFVAIGDPQIRNNASEIGKLSVKCDQLAADLTKLNATLPVHIMVTGDVAFNDQTIHPASRQNFKELGQPVFYAIGNHDHQPTGKTDTNYAYDKTADATFINNYGPTCYSFNRGKVHYIVYDNIYFKGGSDGAKYDIYVTPEQLKWIEKDLTYVDKSKAVVLMAHSPTQTRRAPQPTSYGNSAEIHKLVQGYANVMHISGHTHYNTVCEANNVLEQVIGALCGAHWESYACLDGAVQGYKIFEVDGTQFKWRYTAAEPEYKSKVFNYFTQKTSTRPLTDVSVLCNVWDWDSKWKVEYSTDNGSTWRAMTQLDWAYDPYAYNSFGISSTDGLPSGRQWINASSTDHLFSATVASGITSIQVRVTTRFNEICTETIAL